MFAWNSNSPAYPVFYLASLVAVWLKASYFSMSQFPHLLNGWLNGLLYVEHLEQWLIVSDLWIIKIIITIQVGAVAE